MYVYVHAYLGLDIYTNWWITARVLIIFVRNYAFMHLSVSEVEDGVRTWKGQKSTSKQMNNMSEWSYYEQMSLKILRLDEQSFRFIKSHNFN